MVTEIVISMRSRSAMNYLILCRLKFVVPLVHLVLAADPENMRYLDLSASPSALKHDIYILGFLVFLDRFVGCLCQIF
jgi:hypothetical protein